MRYFWASLSGLSLIAGFLALRYAPVTVMFQVVCGLVMVSILSAILASGIGERRI